jgi:hypothetical protein
MTRNSSGYPDVLLRSNLQWATTVPGIIDEYVEASGGQPVVRDRALR